MKVIIDISEGIYKHVDTIQNGSIGAKQIINSVKNGIPAYKVIPSAEPNTGHWIIIDDCEKFIAKCSECGQIEDSRMIGKYAYCHCGARMVEPQEGSKE